MWLRDGCLNQRSFCVYAEMWELDSAQFLSLAFVSVPTSLLLFFSESIPSFPPFASLISFQYTLFVYNPPSLPFLPTLFLLPLLPSFFPPHFLMSIYYGNSCIFFLTFVFFAFFFCSQCSCRRTRPTRCCGGCAGPTSCWRRWSRGTSSGSAARRSATTRRLARPSRMTRRRWGFGRQIVSWLQFLNTSNINIIKHLPHILDGHPPNRSCIVCVFTVPHQSQFLYKNSNTLQLKMQEQ